MYAMFAHLRKYGFTLLVLMLLGFGAYTQVGLAQTPPPSASFAVHLEATPAFEGNFKYGEWLPIFVEISNVGTDVKANLQVPVQGNSGSIYYSQPVELPAGAHKRLTLYVLPNNFTRQLDVDLVSGETMLATQRVQVHPNPNVNYLVALVAPDRGALSLINNATLPGMKRTKIIVDLPLDQIPERFEGLRSFDLLVFNDLDTTQLTPAQALALETWVSQGGRLVIGGGASAALTVSGLSENLFPGRVINTQEVEALPALENYVEEDRPVRVPGPFILAHLEASSGRLLAGDRTEEIVHEWSLGSGYVDFVALNPAVTPFDAWNGTTNFWEKLIAPGAAYPENLPTDISARQQFAGNIPYVLSNLPILDLPSVKGLALMLGIYIMLVGPVNFLVLRRMKRLQLAWITIPAITIIFSAASFGLGYAMHGTDIFINKISIIQLDETGNAHYNSYIGVFSPAQTNYRLEVEGDGLLSPLTPYYDPWNSFAPPDSVSSARTMTISQGSPAVVEGLSVDQWSMQSVMSEGTIPDFGSIRANLQLADESIVGTIKNTTKYDFQDAFVILGTKFASLGSLAAGQEAEINLDISVHVSPLDSSSLSYAMFAEDLSSSNLSTTDRRRVESRRSLIESLFERQPSKILSSSPVSGLEYDQTFSFIGWIDEAPPAVHIPGVDPGQQSSALIILPLSYQLPEAGQITIPVGLIPGSLIENPREGGSCGLPGTTAVYISGGKATFEFRLPQETNHLKPENLKLGIWSDSGLFSSPNIALYNWKTLSWTTLDGIDQGVNLVPKAADFVNDEGRVQIQLSAEGAQSCYYIALGLEGSQS